VKWKNSLKEGVILNRYKRFFADIKYEEETLTAHVPNTGSMASCWEPNWKCAVSKSDNPDRKLPYTLELTHNGESWIGVNTNNANKIVHAWLEQNLIPELSGYKTIKKEAKIGESRLDFLLDDHDILPPCYVEVKSVTLKLDECAQFPDSVTERGQKHLMELMELKEKGFRSVMLFVIQREDVNRMKPAYSIDRKYAELMKEAKSVGVEFIPCQCRINLAEISFGKTIPLDLE